VRALQPNSQTAAKQQKEGMVTRDTKKNSMDQGQGLGKELGLGAVS